MAFQKRQSYLWGQGMVCNWGRFDRLALVAGLGNVIASLLSGAGNLALIGFFAMLPWVVTGSLRMLPDLQTKSLGSH